MILVIDTNIFLAACFGSRSATQIISDCLIGKHTPLMGSALFAEYEDVLGRQSLFKKSRLTAKERDELLDVFIASSQWVRIYFNWRPNLRDEGDNHLIELAVAGNAEAIITRNLRDFNQAELQFPGLFIYTPEQFIEVNTI